MLCCVQRAIFRSSNLQCARSHNTLTHTAQRQQLHAPDVDMGSTVAPSVRVEKHARAVRKRDMAVAWVAVHSTSMVAWTQLALWAYWTYYPDSVRYVGRPDSARIDVHRSSSGVCDPAGGTVSTVVCSVPALHVCSARCSSPHMPKDDGVRAVSVLVPTIQAHGTDHVHCGAQPGFGGVQWESS